MTQPRFFIFALLFTAVFKNDAYSLLSNSSDWSSLTVYPLFSEFKKKSYIGFFLMIAVGILFLTKNKILIFPKSSSLQIFAFLLIFSSLRVTIFDEILGLKVIAGALIYLFSYIYFSALINKIGYKAFLEELFYVLYLFAAFYISVNLINNILGHGYVWGFPRYFGVTTHPNFLGVQLALCVIIIFARIKISLDAIFPLLFFCAGMWLLLITGSRTGFLMLVFGVATYVQLSNNFKYKYLIVFFIFGLLYLFYITADDDTFLVFDRGSGGADTRSGAWKILYTAFLQNPIFGKGYFKGASESSYLRMLVNYGFIYLTLFFILTLKLWKKFVSLYFHSKNDETLLTSNCIAFSLLVALLVGGFFEGFLADIYSFQVVIFFILCLISTKKIYKPKLYF